MSDNESPFQAFLDDYFSECDEHLSGASRELLALEDASGTPDAERRSIDNLFRYFHSLKGISAMVDLRPAEGLAHALEDYLRALRGREVPLTPIGIDALIEATQRLEPVSRAHRCHQAQPAIDDVLARAGRTRARSR